MAKAKKLSIYLDPFGNTINMWWGKVDKGSESIEASESDDVIIVNSKGEAIGLEKLNFFPKEMNTIKYFKGEINTMLDGLFTQFPRLHN